LTTTYNDYHRLPEVGLVNGQRRYEEHKALQALIGRMPKKFREAYLPEKDMPDIRIKSASVGLEVIVGEDIKIHRILSMINRLEGDTSQRPLGLFK
ncbi:hypothetical protein U6Y60_05100, partial [Lacticaseibacillus paracasei]|uniref:hypothetical protein n=1 Tax=Lacticaseibacillus paracasei TaxID=1597 RepID=UPI002ADED907